MLMKILCAVMEEMRVLGRLALATTCAQEGNRAGGRPVHVAGPARTSASWPREAEAGRGWMEAVLSLSWRWRGVLAGEWAEASGRLLSTAAAHLEA